MLIVGIWRTLSPATTIEKGKKEAKNENYAKHMHECINRNRMDITMCPLYENNYTTYPDCFRMFELTATKGTEKTDFSISSRSCFFFTFCSSCVSMFCSLLLLLCFVSTNLQNIMLNHKHVVYGIFWFNILFLLLLYLVVVDGMNKTHLRDVNLLFQPQ